MISVTTRSIVASCPMLCFPEIRTSARAYRYIIETRKIMPGRSSSMLGLSLLGLWLGLAYILVLNGLCPIFLQHTDLAVRFEGGLPDLFDIIHAHQPQFREQFVFIEPFFGKIFALNFTVFHDDCRMSACQPV